ncbi:hypothetical protein B0H17DRAFT_1190731 [Mycena rosella]|uniref:Uncharacterized protein n=1 Tax=Mycena rosella TaxID=1033263 RepID=A0AAD7H0M6_MYCRO|nr:hypothetical protein B0H17DRAFT_1190731 [Mycena rosella]
MLASFSLISATLAVFVSAMPSSMGEISARGPFCAAGSFYNTSATACTLCPPGNTCNGNQSPQPCDYGRYQPLPGQTTCLQTPKGFYQPQRGQATFLPCYLGSYQPNAGQAFCYGAPNGRFQGVIGQPGVCGACCGWATNSSSTNFNTNVYQCQAPTPFSGRASGSGCASSYQGCTPVATCAQTFNGTAWNCPDQTFY